MSFLSVAIALACWANPPARGPLPLLLKQGDRLAIVGDSITEQKQYSRVVEAYLRACRPDLQVDVRQFGWSGETGAGFLARMESDCLRFKPTLATTCYGMNDHGYTAYTDAIGNSYRTNLVQIVEKFEKAGARVLIGSPGIITKVPGWVRQPTTVEAMSENLKRLGDIGWDLALAKRETRGFADVSAAMATVQAGALKDYGDRLAPAGRDGVHPGDCGQTAMAYAFLKGLVPAGQPLATIELSLSKRKAAVTPGHEVIKFDGTTLSLRSRQFPFAPSESDDPTASGKIATQYLPFQADLNQVRIVVADANPKRNYLVRWGTQEARVSGTDLKTGIDLVKQFPNHPLVEPFRRVEAAVYAKQVYETQQIKTLFRQDDFKSNPNWVASQSEKVRSALVDAIEAARAPVDHTITIKSDRR